MAIREGKGNGNLKNMACEGDVGDEGDEGVFSLPPLRPLRPLGLLSPLIAAVALGFYVLGAHPVFVRTRLAVYYHQSEKANWVDQ